MEVDLPNVPAALPAYLTTLTLARMAKRSRTTVVAMVARRELTPAALMIVRPGETPKPLFAPEAVEIVAATK